MAAVIVLSGAAGGAQAQTTPQATSQTPPLSAYGAAPSIENIELSPSGGRIARITVVGEERAVLVSDFNTGETLFRARIGDTKVRDLTWIGEKRILVVTSQTRGIPLIGIPRTELYFGLIVDLEKRKMVQVLDPTENVISVLYGPAMRRAGKPTELIELSGEDHWLSRAETRQKMLAETVRFLEVNNPVH
ncbi:alpha/beta hydrolase family protein [Brevundimonas nasdae]|uniref:alpha/beta hydrolase family protein n=1 Tax=Brevundimonas nasdae TaxID=172043 RepID=UPI00289D7075|nr:hypothetical protein [Brevundimonas nasdae]